MQDLVRIRIADSAKQARIGKRPFDCVVFPRQRLTEAVQIGSQYLEPATVERQERRPTTNNVQRRALSRTRFGEQKRTGCEVERCETKLSRDRGSFGPKSQPTCNHQV